MKTSDIVWSVLLIGFVTTQILADDRLPRLIPNGTDTRDRFLKLIERPRVPLNSNERHSVVVDGLLETGFVFDAEENQRVPGVLLKMESTSVTTRRPAVIVLHGTGGSKEAMKPLLRKLANHGLIAVAMDARFSGERATFGKGSDNYRAAILETWKTGNGYPFYYDTVWDLQRLIDYLETRPDVDSNRIGALGMSKGGTELYLAAAVDTRILATVSCIGVQSFDWALEHNAWQSRISTIQSAVNDAARDVNVTNIDSRFIRRFYQRVVPGIEKEFDGPQMLPLIAPRPLLVINGEKDDRTPGPGLELCVSAARKAYLSGNASHNFEFWLQPNVGHAVTPESEHNAIEWLIEKLK